jgi:energy-coupling factor transporter ATP-binding protein EcfA2
VGKSTLLKTLAGLLKPQAGKIYYQGADITPQRVDQRARFIAYVPQDPNSVLFADTLLTELDFTLRGLKLAAVMPPREFLAELSLDGYAERYPRDLSGGERQRAALAAMLIADRPVMLLDEPTMGLDYRQRHQLVRLLQTWKQQGHSIVLATHDLELAARVADHVVILEAGHIQVQGPPREVFLHTPGYQTQLAQVFGLAHLLTTDDLKMDG